MLSFRGHSGQHCPSLHSVYTGKGGNREDTGVEVTGGVMGEGLEGGVIRRGHG